MSELRKHPNHVRNPEVWDPRGKRRPSTVQEVARRLQAGEDRRTIATALGISLPAANVWCRQIAAALNLPSKEDDREAFGRKVGELVKAGHTDASIAKQLNITKNMVISARTRALGPKYTLVRLTNTERDRIDQMLTQGFNHTEIADEIGCSAVVVGRRAQGQDLSNTQPTRPPCACGRPAGHGGRCRTRIDPEFIKERLLVGVTSDQIAREVGRAPSSAFRRVYCRPVIEQLTAEGLTCGCGQPFGHRNRCEVTAARLRQSFSDSQKNQGRELVRAGASSKAVSLAMGLNANSALRLVQQIRGELAAAGEVCPCGQAIDHSRPCAVRSKGATQPGFRFSRQLAQIVPVESRQLISALARKGWTRSAVERRTGVKREHVRQIFRELSSAGALPEQCNRCGGAAGHGGTCARARCACGLSSGHAGACRPTPPTSDKQARRRRGLTDEDFAELKRRYRAKQSTAAIAEALSVSITTVNKHIGRVRKASSYSHKPCACAPRPPSGFLFCDSAACGDET